MQTRSRRAVRLRWAFRFLLGAGTVALAAGAAFLVNLLVLGHFHPVVDGKVYRSAQPSAAMLRRWISTYHLRAVLNLRGESSSGAYASEREVTAEQGVRLVDIPLSAVRPPSRRSAKALVEALETAPTPLLIHCNYGVDRAGVASVLAAMAVGGARYDEARKQLSWRHLRLLPLGGDVTGLLAEYEEHCRRRAIGTGGWKEFKRWLWRHYGRN